MIPEKEIRALLESIERSNSLGASSIYSRLLRFLVEGTLSKTVPNEQAIAEHLLGKNFAKSDSSKIRAYVYHLRKKLSQYFENEGKEETYLLSIPKGGYRVQFKKNERNTHFSIIGAKKKRQTWVLPLVILLLGSVMANAYFLVNTGRNHENDFSGSPFWEEFFDDEKPIQIVVGDLFIFSEYDSLTGETSNLRIPQINTPVQFDDYRNAPENQGRDLREMTYTHLLKATTEWISALTKVFYPNRAFHIRSSSRMEAKDVLDYNIVFVGMQKTAGIFNDYFDRSDFGYGLSGKDHYHLRRDTHLLTFKPKGDPDNKHSDFGFIAKYPGPNDNTIFMFGGLWDSAASESLRNFAISSKMAKVEHYMREQLGHIPPYFEMLIEVQGVDRVGFETRFIHLSEIPGPE